MNKKGKKKSRNEEKSGSKHVSQSFSSTWLESKHFPYALYSMGEDIGETTTDG